LGIHMTYSHGWFDNQPPTIKAFLHQKTLYGRIGRPSSLINIFGGLNHNVSWGGEAYSKVGNDFDYYPSNLSSYFYVVTVLKNRTILPTDPNASWDDLNYQFGNHLGSVDIAVKFQKNNLEILAYRQSMYETGRIAALTQINDGLSGISIKIKKTSLLNSIGFEYLYTANQGNYSSGISQFLGIKDPHAIEIESYQNNGGRGPWKYWNKSLGTPLNILDLESSEGGGYFFSKNAIISYFFFLKGVLPKSIKWNTRISNSYYAKPRNHTLSRLSEKDFINQLSISLTFEKSFNQKLYSQLQIGFDKGERVKNTLGCSFSMKYYIF